MEHGKYAGIAKKGLTVATEALGFWSAFLNSVAMIIVTELGDKTFFIAAIMAMRNPRGIIFAGAVGALIIMTILSTVIGFALPQLLPKSSSREGRGLSQRTTAQPTQQYLHL